MAHPLQYLALNPLSSSNLKAWGENQMKSKRILFGFFSAMPLLTGCATTLDVHKVAEFPAQIENHEVIAILTTTNTPAVDGAVGCISDAIKAAKPNVRIISPDEFRRTIFSYRVTQEGKAAEYLTSLAKHPVIRKQMASMGIRYLISVDGATQSSADSLEGECVGGGGFIGCGWDRRTRLEVSVVDLKDARLAGKVHVSTSGTAGFIIIPLPPFIVPLPAFTESL